MFNNYNKSKISILFFSITIFQIEQVGSVGRQVSLDEAPTPALSDLTLELDQY